MQLKVTSKDAVKEQAPPALQGLLARFHATVMKVAMQEVTAAVTFVK